MSKKRKVKKSRKKTRKVKKSRKKTKRKKISREKQIFKAPNQSKDSEGNTIIKVSESWANHAYVNDSKYKKNINFLLKKMKSFGPRRENEFHG